MKIQREQDGRIFPPACWQWAWSKVDKTKSTTSNDLISYHSLKRKECPICLGDKNYRAPLDRRLDNPDFEI